MHTRQRNEEDKQRKDGARRLKEAEEDARLETNLAQKEASRQAIHMQNASKQQKQLGEAQRLKDESAKNAQIIALQKEQEYMKNNNIKEMIR